MNAKNTVISVLTLLLASAAYAQNAATGTSTKSENNQPATKGVYSLAAAMANGGREMKAVAMGETTKVFWSAAKNALKKEAANAKDARIAAFLNGGREMKYVNAGYNAYEKMHAKRQAAQAEKAEVKTAPIKFKDVPFGGREMKYVNAGYNAYEKMHAKQQAAQAQEASNTVTIPDMAKVLVSEGNNFKNVLSGVKFADNPYVVGGREGKIMAMSDNLSAFFVKQKAKNEQRKWAELSKISTEAKEFIDVLLKNGKYNALSSFVMNKNGKLVKTVCNGKEYSYDKSVTEQDVMYVLYSLKKDIALHAPQADSQVLCNVIMNRYKGALPFNVAKSINAQLVAAAK